MLQPQSAADYIRTNLEMFAKDIHPMDQIELHKQTGEMVYSTLADKTLLAHKLQNSLNNTTVQLELEKASSQAKDNRIKSLEEIIIELRHDPSNPKAVQALMKKNEEDIAALRKMVKLPATLHPQTEGIAQQKKDDDVVAMLLALHKRLIETEGALQVALQQREGGQTSQPPQPVFNLEEPPQIITSPTEQTAETGPATSAPATTSEQAPSLDMQKMMKEIQVLEAQMAELNQTKEKLATINEKYDKSKQYVAEKAREVKALKEKIKELEKELSLDKVVAEIKKVLWAKIGQSITDQWQYIETIHEHIDLIGRAHKENQKARAALGNMPEIANRMINVLNNRTGPQLAAMGISNRTDTILLIKRVLTLRTLVQTLDRRCQEMQTEVNKFVEKFTVLHNRGLPSLLNSAGRLLSHENYAKRVNTFATNQITATSSAPQETGPTSGQSLYDKIENLFFIMNEIRHMFEVPPNYYKYTEADETLGEILRHQLPTQEWWAGMIQTLL